MVYAVGRLLSNLERASENAYDMALVSAFFEILQRPTIWDVLTELMFFMAPLWVATIVGVVVGWAWKPKWVNLSTDSLDSSSRSKNGSSLTEWPASFSCLIPSSLTIPSLDSLKLLLTSCISWLPINGLEEGNSTLSPSTTFDCSSSKPEKAETAVVGKDDLEHLCRIVEEKDGGPAWIQMMDRSTPAMSYRAWRRDSENGPPQYRSSTIFEDATTEMVRDFFWDDEFRMKWDDMLTHAEILEECPNTGTLVVQWVRKVRRASISFSHGSSHAFFPSFVAIGSTLSAVGFGNQDDHITVLQREYRTPLYPGATNQGVLICIIQVGIYEQLFVLVYFSVESKRGDGQLTACEVLLFHHEDMGIPWEIAKLGIRQGMWGAVKKIEPGLRAYQRERESGAPLSRCAFMARINTKISADYLDSLESTRSSSSEVETLNSSEEKPRRNIPKLLVIGGAIALACSLDRGLLTKAVIFGVARRFGNIGKKL
ncbi:hypothetical protein RHGRI_006136 [Rhododendron griersonianum]|uniref:START domain-containing protein n=1 Tax=Rhododendron griersonianum TaxID=479676 RepID=A0AAV6LEP7_9ERIC|nr:hypothetical protein RHGRI_006136 [Rhododendron griersonianum]